MLVKLLVPNVIAITEMYTLSLHDALPIYIGRQFRELDIFHAGGVHDEDVVLRLGRDCHISVRVCQSRPSRRIDRKRKRLNSSHVEKSYAVFCMKKIKDAAE